MTRSGVILSIVMGLSATVPFLDKAYHIDDVLYLAVAEQIRRTPMDPYGVTENAEILWDAIDGRPDSLFQIDFNPPLWKYLLAGGMIFLGNEEWKLHLFSTMAVVVAALGIYASSCRFTTRPIWCVAMIIWGPFFLPGINLMLEAPLLAFLSWAIFFQWRSWDNDRLSDGLIAGILIGLAILTKYTIGVFLLLFTVGSLMKRRPRSLIFLLPAVSLLGLWCLHNLWMYDRLHVTSHGVVFRPDLWISRFLAVLRIIGATSLFSPIWCWELWKRGFAGRVWLIVAVAGALGVGFFDLHLAQSYLLRRHLTMTPGLEPFFVVFAAFGALQVLSTVGLWLLSRYSFRWDEDDRQWELWLIVLGLFNVISVPFNAVRHMLVFFLALTWLSARLADRWQRPILPHALLIASSLLAFALAMGDYDYANGYRTYTRTAIREACARYPRVWFSGTWGFKYYAEKEGAIAYYPGIQQTNLGKPIPGDIFYHPQLLNWAPVMLTVEGSRRQQIDLLPAQFPQRLVLKGINYYGVGPELVPWGWIVTPSVGEHRWAPLDAISIHSIELVP
ncbi:glycosyltransferase family 39 protein [bacterium]|nr:glycosyltransferase family 39 protein [bacterium]